MHTFLYVKNIRKISFVYLEQSTIKHKSCVCYVYYYFFCSYLFFRPKKVWKKIHTTQFTIVQLDYFWFTSTRKIHSSTVICIYNVYSIYMREYILAKPTDFEKSKEKKNEIQKKILVENKTKNPSICLSSAIRMYDCSNKNNTRLTIVYSRSRRDSTSSI